MRIASVVIAKNEDHYIDEWINYQFKIGVDEIFIYQNNWRYENTIKSEKIHLIEFDGQKMQIPAYMDFVSKYSDNFDFGIFFDIDEFLVFKYFSNIKDCLINYLDIPVIAIPEKVFGDNNLSGIINNNYNVLTRFTKTTKKYSSLYKKNIINFSLIRKLKNEGKINEFKFMDPHYTNIPSVDSNKKIVNVGSLFPETIKNENEIIEKFHFPKTFEEYKITKLCGDVFFGDKICEERTDDKLREMFNINGSNNEEVNPLALNIFNRTNKNNKKIAFIQFDNRINDFNTNVKNINKKYCDLNNYFYYFDDTFKAENYSELLEYTNDNEYFKMISSCYHRFKLALTYMNNFDYVIISDSDVLISNPLIKFENIIDNIHDLFLTQDINLLFNTLNLYKASIAINDYCNKNKIQYTSEYNNINYEFIGNKNVLRQLLILATNYKSINGGFLIFKNSEISRSLINDVLIMLKISENMLVDQGILGMLLETKKYKNIYSIFPMNFIGNSSLDHMDFSYKEDFNFINHIYGGSLEKRMQSIDLIKNNKWWRMIK